MSSELNTASTAYRKRPWYRLHGITVAAGAITAATLLVIVVPAEMSCYYWGCWGPGVVERHFDHGWPQRFLSRAEESVPRRTVPTIDETVLPSWTFFDSWTLGGKIELWEPTALVVDLATMVAITLATLAVVEFWRRRRQSVFQLRLSELLFAILAMSCVCGWLGGHHAAKNKEANAESLRERFWVDDPYLGPEWLGRLIGKKVDLFHHIDSCSISAEAPVNATLFAEIAAQWPYLRSVGCSHPNVTPEQLADLRACPRLRKLDMRELPIDDDMLTSIASLPNVDTIDFVDCCITATYGLRTFENMKSLKNLRLWRTPCDFEELSLLVQLESLAIDDSSTGRERLLTERGLQRLARLPRLESLVLRGIEMSTSDRDELLAARPGLEIEKQ